MRDYINVYNFESLKDRLGYTHVIFTYICRRRRQLKKLKNK